MASLFCEISVILSTPCRLEGPGVSAFGLPRVQVCMCGSTCSYRPVYASTDMHTNTNWMVVYVFLITAFTFEQFDFCFVFPFCLLSFYVWCMTVHSVSCSSTVWLWIIVCDYRCTEKSFRVWSQMSALQLSEASCETLLSGWTHEELTGMRQGGALRINCPLCCHRDDTQQELRDQAYTCTKKVKQTKKS